MSTTNEKILTNELKKLIEDNKILVDNIIKSENIISEMRKTIEQQTNYQRRIEKKINEMEGIITVMNETITSLNYTVEADKQRRIRCANRDKYSLRNTNKHI